MTRRRQENLIALAFLALFVAVIVMSLQFGPRARMVPIPVASLAILLVIAQLLVQNTGSEEELHVDLLEVLTRRQDRPAGAEGGAEAARPAASAARPEAPPGGDGIAGARRREWVALGLVAAMLGLILLLGPVPAVFLFMFLYFATFGGYRWYVALGFSLSVTVVLYLLFFALLQTQIYYGILTPLVFGR